jgi:predicted metalloprotease with PDZ domain
LPRVDNEDLNLFEFDYDLTFMVFFLSADDQVYARYGGRDSTGSDKRLSLAGLAYTMHSVLQMHRQADKAFAPKSQETPKYLRDLAPGRRVGRCLHCHQIKETLNASLQRAGQWSRDLIWRYPLPTNLGFDVEVDRGNVVKEVKDASPAFKAGLRAGDRVQRLGGVPAHSFADMQLALDRAPKTGSIELVWQRGDQVFKQALALPEGWRQSDLTWRPSMQRWVASARLYGDDLTPEEKKALGLPAQQLAFRQQDSVPAQARAAGIQAGDIIVGIDDKPLEMDVTDFVRYVRRQFLVGDRVTVNVLRDGKHLNLPMTLLR